MNDNNYYITTKELYTGNEDMSGIPAGVLVRGGWDRERAYYVFRHITMMLDPKVMNTATLSPNQFKESGLVELDDFAILELLIESGKLDK